jgi:hypothetical protein
MKMFNGDANSIQSYFDLYNRHYSDLNLTTLSASHAAKAAFQVVFFGFELCSKPKNTLFTGGYSRKIRFKS